MSDSDVDASDELDMGDPIPHLSRGALRRVMQHTGEAYDRLTKAADIIEADTGEALDASDYGGAWNLTEAISTAGDSHSDARREYYRRREAEDE